jgi:uncharacterized delta-60 repeat protein
MRFNKISTFSLCAAIVLLSAIFASAQNAQYVGDLDRTFANGGVFQDPTQPDPTLPYPANNIATYFANGALTADGKIITGGTIVFDTGAAEASNDAVRSDFYLRRLLPNGAIDTTFGTNGYVRTDFFRYGATNPRSTSSDTAYKIRLQADGKIVLLGLCYDNYHYSNGGVGGALGTDVCLVRYNADGSLDQSFGGNTVSTRYRNDTTTYTFDRGKVFTYTGTKDSEGTQRYNPIPDDLQIQADGKIVVVGTSGDAIPNTTNGSTNQPFAFILRYNTDGTLDTTFGSGGEVKYPGRPVYDSNGNLRGYTAAEFKAVKIQTDGKIIAVGNDQPNAFFGTYGGRAVVTRYSANGQLELTSFLDDGGLGNQANSVDFLRGNKILVGGVSSANTGRNAVARYNSDLSLDMTFGTGGKVTYDGSFTANGTRINDSLSQYFAIQIIQPDGKFIATDNFGNLYRYNPDGTPDHSFGNGGGNPGDPNNYGFAGTFRSTTPTPGNQTGITFGSALLRPDGRILTFGGIGSNYNAVDGRGTITQQYSFFHSGIYSDFNNDGRGDLSVYRPSEGNWYYLDSFNTIFHPENTFRAVHFGVSTDKIVPADYDGDGRTDMAVYRSGSWYILQSASGTVRYVTFGLSDDLPAPGDFDGDGLADISVFRPSNGIFYRLDSSTNQYAAIRFGLSGDVPVLGDYDGDGKTDFTLFRPSQNVWYILQSSDFQVQEIQFGATGDVPVAGDFNGDSKSDLAVFRPSNGTWYIARTFGRTAAQNFDAVKFGVSTDTPVPADYDGDGKTDIAVYRNGTWIILQSLTNQGRYEQFGLSSDKPIPAAFQP